MCACGCFLMLAIAAALFYCVTHGMWLAAALIVAGAVAIGWFSQKAMRGRGKSRF